MNKTFSSKLTEARLRAGHSQKSLALLTGIDPRRISHFEQGTRPPSDSEREALIAVELLNPDDFDDRPERNFQSDWLQRLPIAPVVSDRSLETRLAAARKTFGSRVSGLLSQVDSLPDGAARLDFLRHANSESGLEAYLWLALVSEGARIAWLSPSRVGFRKWAVVDPKSREILSDARFPAVEMTLNGYPVLAFPQLTLQARNGSIYRLDGLLGIMVGQNRVWVDIEIDGAGHDASFDSERETKLDLPRLSLAVDNLQVPHLTSMLAEKLRPFSLGYTGS